MREYIKSIPLSQITPDMWQSWGITPVNRSLITISEAYSYVPWVYRAVELVSNAIGSLPLCWYRGDDEIEDIDDLPIAGKLHDLLNVWAGDLMLYGAAYAYMPRTGVGLPALIQRLHPATITIQPDAETGQLLHFRRAYYNENVIVKPKDMLYVWTPNRLAELGPGVSAVFAALQAAGVLATMDDTANMRFRNGAVRPTVAHIEGNPSETERERLQTYLQRALSGVAKAFGITAVTKAVTFETIGDPLDTLAIPELTAAKREDVATALGVPQSLLFSNAANFATARQDDLHFYDKTVIPLTMHLLQALNTQVLARYGLRVETAEHQLELYQDSVLDKSTALGGLKDLGIVTANEVRERMGFDRVDDPAADELAATPTPPAFGQPAPADDAPEAMPDDMPDMTSDGTEPEDDDDEPVRDEMRAWERFLTRRIKGEKSDREFEVRSIPTHTAAFIRGALEGVETVDAVKAVFAEAQEWGAYP